MPRKMFFGNKSRVTTNWKDKFCGRILEFKAFFFEAALSFLSDSKFEIDENFL